MPGHIGGTDPARRPSILIVSPFEEDHAQLRALLELSGAHVYSLFDVEDALNFARRRRLAAIICEHEFEGRDEWKRLLHGLNCLEPPPALIVASRLAAGALWAEVPDFGGFDLLVKPFERDEALRVARRAIRKWLGEAGNPNPVDRQFRAAEAGAAEILRASNDSGPSTMSDGRGGRP